MKEQVAPKPASARRTCAATARARTGKLARNEPSGVVVLFSAPEGADPGSISPADRETAAVARDVARVLREKSLYQVALVSAESEVGPKLAPYPPRDWVVFNLFEGLDGRVGPDGRSIDDESPAALMIESLGYRFTGADGHALALALNKARTKRLLAKAGVSTPPWAVFRSASQVTPGHVRNLPFPLIVKPVAEDSSVAIDDGAVVADLAELKARVGFVTEQCRQQALAEAFIDGREINVAIWGNPPEALPLAEIDLSAISEPNKRIVGYAAKWNEETWEYSHTPAVCPAQLAEEPARIVRETALRAWSIVTRCWGYGRVDLRLKGETAYVLEVNPNPSIASDAGFARSARAAGLTYEQMILKILSFALEDRRADFSSC